MQADADKGPTVWLHVGLPKCGSTAIQRRFADHEARFAEQGLCYPKAHRTPDGYRSHRPLAWARAEGLPGMVSDIATEAQGARAILISCEDFANALPGGLARPLVAALEAQFGADNLRVIVYARNLFDLVESAYAQFLLGGLFRLDRPSFFANGAPSLRRFLDAFEAAKGFPLYALAGYARLIQSTFGAQRVSFRSVEAQDLDHADLVEDLCAVMGIRPEGTAQRLNQRADPGLIAAFQYAQTLIPAQQFDHVRDQFRAFRFSATSSAQAERDPSLRTDAELHAAMCARIAEDQETLAELFDTRIDGLVADRWRPAETALALDARAQAEVRAFMARLL